MSNFMNYLKELVCLIALIITAMLPAMAQEERFTEEEGEVVEGEFLISKELEITLPAAQRIFQKVPPDEIEVRETEPLEYTFMQYTPELKDIRTRLRVLKLKEEKINSGGPSSYLNVGFGNYITPYLEAALNSGVNKLGNYGVRLRHLSSHNGPVDDENSGDSHSAIGLFGKYAGTKASIGGDLGYERNGYHFYGYDEGIEVDRDTIQQAFNTIKFDFDIKGSDPDAPVQYSIYGKIHNISDDYSASEFAAKTGLSGTYLINDDMQARLGLDFLFGSYKNPDQINRSLVRVHPSFVYRNFGLTLDVGLKVVNHNDTLNNKNKTQIFPSLMAGYDLSDNILAYARLDGDVEEVTFRSIAEENPYVNSNIPVAHTNKNFDLHIGLKGSLAQYLAFDVGVRSAIYKNMYFYVNDPLEFNKFSLIYDEGNTTLLQGLISLSYFKGSTMGTTLAARLNAYSTGKVEKAWHRPNLELDYSFWYNFYDKVKLHADLFVLSGIDAPDFGDDPVSSIKLKGAVDLNLKVDYILSERYSAFVSVNNLLGNNYQLYQRYQSRGLLAIVGVSVSF
jgi:hypothetical protein